jgi:hypothetical protein
VERSTAQPTRASVFEKDTKTESDRRLSLAPDHSSWAGMCPGNNESAGKRGNTRTRKGNTVRVGPFQVC